MTKLVKCGEFVKRQTPESGFSHFDGSWERLEDMTIKYMSYKHPIRPGYKDGVILVDFDALDSTDFYSALVELNEETKLNVSYAPRRVEEAPFIRISAKGNKQVARYASVVLYRFDVLAENNERETDADWEIVAIKARTSIEEEPMDPYTMARNFLHLKGGTKGDFTAEQFAQSIVYWNNHAMTTGKPKWYRMLAKFGRWLKSLIREGCKENVDNVRTANHLK